MKFFSSFILSLCSVLGFSQTILYQTENTSRTVQDPQVVVLAQGFHATSATSNPFVAKIGPGTENPGGGPIDSGAGATNPSGTIETADNKFHDTKGDIDVSGSGQLQFSLPVALPPGVKSVAPQVNLVYTSGSGNGIAGYGWNISGISAISRAGKTVEKDGEAQAIQLDYSDYYSFNGQRLILKNGEYGKDGAEYVTEKYSNVKIKSVGSITGQSWKGPEYWEVTFEDGSQAWYGGVITGNSTSRTPVEYNIAKWKDAHGNYITYNYIQSAQDNVAVISSMEWGGNETLNKPHFNSVNFGYITRNFIEKSYVRETQLIQSKLLNNIIVKTNNTQFRKYSIDYFSNGTNYQFVNTITEYNTDNNPANPITFTYPSPTSQTLEYSTAPTNTDDFDKVRFTGDFNGDSYLDFIMYNGTVRLGAFNETLTDVSTNKIFSSEAKVVNTLLDEEGQIYNGNGIVQYENGKIAGYIFRNNTFVKVFEKTIYDTAECSIVDIKHSCSINAVFHDGDIEGDGISNIILSLDRTDCYLETIHNPNEGLPPGGSTCYDSHVGEFIIDLKNKDNPISTYTIDTNINESLYTNQQYMDIDGDGKVDIINISDTTYTVFEFVKTAPNQYLKKIRFSGNLVETKDSEFPLLFGDFNGDGNLDFTIPVTDNQNADNWRFYMGTEKGFSNFLKTDFLKFRKPNSSTGSIVIDRHFYSISDINKDGKSDIIYTYSYNKQGQTNSNGSSNYRNFGYDIYTYLSNGYQVNGNLDFSASNNLGGHIYSTLDWQEYKLFSPITAQMKVSNNYYDVFLFWKDRLHKLKAPSSIGQLAQVKSINQGSLSTAILYKELNPDLDSNFYKKIKKEYYPYFSLLRSDQSYAVSQIIREGRKQDFRYRGMTGHMQGKGMVGYHQTARSSWYADGFETTKIWTGVEIDPVNEGVPVKEWSIKATDENKIFPTDLSENNTQLLNFKSNVYQADIIVNGSVVTIVSDADKPKAVTALVPKSTRTKDFLTGSITTSTITYEEHYLPTLSISNVNNGYAITTSEFEYIHNPSGVGSNYYIGRPKTKTDATQAYGDLKSAKEEYIYENNFLKNLKTWNRDNTGYLQETYDYDDFGNIIKKTTNNSIDSQTQTIQSTYDTKGRFVEKTTDNLGLETNIIYNNFGQIIKQTDALGNSIENTYDNWGKLLKVKTNLGGTTTYQYEKDNNSNVIVTENDPDGNISKKYSNKLGQGYKASTKAFGQGQFISTETQYDILGRKLKESEPYFEGQSPNQWNSIEYDDSFFPSKVTATAFNGKKMETIVSGLTTTVKELNGYNRTNSKTADALGNAISTTDKGGTIQFSYNAAGEQIKAQYAENIVTTKYDSWGRKSEFNDPSNGTYKYEYDGFGKPKKIISPKGTKEYTYNNLGQLISHSEISTTDSGQATNKIISYTYDNKGRIISRSGTSKGQPYSSNIAYDLQGRVLSSSESSNGKYFIQKGITYDDKARVISYEKSLYSSGTLTKVTVENIYSAWNGELSQIKDKNSGKILWELKETNSKGQALKAKLGATDIINTYDANGFLTNVNHSSSVKSGILQLSYSFDAIKNELKSRTTGGDFNIVESFDYDDNNRVVNWTNPVTGIKPTLNRNVYDVKGRILENDQVGTIKYENAAKIYQPTGMTLNAAGTQNYNNDLIQSIAYNENNDPVFIDGMKGDVSFQYGLTSMRQKVSYGGNFDPDQEGKFTKFYSEDGSFEIIKNNITGKEKHVLYIGGSPYESNIVYLKDYTESSGSYKFLHKDYIGSILAISDETGNKLEQRHFDAWGNFTHLQVGNGPIITDKSIIDTTPLLIERGYTSHEHFTEVGIIHMNGRLYDPLLRRFLNADENIQDPTNTQIYNKYGYALNNPLIYNDPSGEVLPFLVGVGLGCFWATVISGAIVGAAISVGMYALQATLNNSWSWGGFAKSILMGTVTGAVSAGAGQIFSTSGFWATVGNGALAGGGSGGIVSLINGDNFLEGLVKGAVIGGAAAAVSYTVSYFASGSYKTKYFSKDNVANSNDFTYDPTVSKETMQENISAMRTDNFTREEIQTFGVGTDRLATNNVDLYGYLDPGNGKQYAYTLPKNFITGKSNIVYAPITAQNKSLLAIAMVHETGHAYGNVLGLIDISIDREKYNISSGNLNTTQHFAISKLEHVYAKYNLINYSSRNLNIFVDYDDLNFTEYFKLSTDLRTLIDGSYDKLIPVFQRFMYYKR
ncbi:FG-GAP-like repeat-containing protein [Chryseobacterium soli]|uniref:SpvB/TcaC N-terminal domain-containing protein n=1 Tax=Chryseobacterium soli TaxID=445961 RepID=UPI0029542C5C|nr:SpvB/TcaC N-terminal domain-containing protein [Chryseobacterium soli]MDV7697046.1 FG-GAP-like repeat-containing protein [Chryseobacterium soli]